MTSDGINEQDWDDVHELACAIVNADTNEDEVMSRIYSEKLFAYLDSLESKYGRLPSILATRGDFASDFDPVPLWEEAYLLAHGTGDSKNQLYIAESLASHFFNAKNFQEALKWVKIGEKALATCPDEFYADELKQIREQVTRCSDEFTD